mgnify:FL=1
MTRGCIEQSKSIPRAKLEGFFENVLKSLTPTRRLLDLAKVMFADAWNMRAANEIANRKAWEKEVKATEAKIEKLLDQIVESQNQTVVRRLEGRINDL